MHWIGMLENWRAALSERLGHSAEDTLEANVLQTEFTDAGEYVQFRMTVI